MQFEKEQICSVECPFVETGKFYFQDRSPWLEGQLGFDVSYDLFSTDAVTLDELQCLTIDLRCLIDDEGLKVHFA